MLGLCIGCRPLLRINYRDLSGGFTRTTDIIRRGLGLLEKGWVVSIAFNDPIDKQLAVLRGCMTLLVAQVGILIDAMSLPDALNLEGLDRHSASQPFVDLGSYILL